MKTTIIILITAVFATGTALAGAGATEATGAKPVVAIIGTGDMGDSVPPIYSSDAIVVNDWDKSYS